MTPSSYGPFVVSLSSNQRKEVRRLAELARSHGIAEQFEAHFNFIWEKLKNHPRDFGDPQFKLPHAKMIIYQCHHADIYVTYGVHDRMPIVFIREIKLFPGHPLA